MDPRPASPSEPAEAHAPTQLVDAPFLYLKERLLQELIASDPIVRLLGRARSEFYQNVEVMIRISGINLDNTKETVGSLEAIARRYYPFVMCAELQAPFEEFCKHVLTRMNDYIRYSNDVRFYHEERLRLTKYISSYYDLYYPDLGEEPDSIFPLVALPAWLLKEPLHLTAETERRAISLNKRPPAFDPPLVPVLGVPLHVIRRQMAPAGTLYDAPAYRLLGVTEGAQGVEFEFGRCRYFDYVDSLEGLGVELAAWYISHEAWRTPHGENRPDPDGSDLPLRGPASKIFDFRSRAAVPGVNVFFAVLNYKGGDWFYLHDRLNTEEAPNTHHVVPAGTFQPEDEGGHDGRDFSFRRTIFREFVEELGGLPEARESASGSHSVLDEPGAERFTQLLYDEERTRLHLLGLGLDPVTTKPEILACLVIDMSEVQLGLEFRERKEGRSYPVELTLEEVRSRLAEPRLLAAGKACLGLVAKHYDTLFPKLGRAAKGGQPDRRRGELDEGETVGRELVAAE